MKKRIRYKYKIVTLLFRNSIFATRLLKYNLVYKKGEIVKALEGTLGIFCFKRRYEAEDFIINSCLNKYRPYEIIRVIPVGRGFCPKKISIVSTEEYFDSFYKDGGKRKFSPSRKTPPQGTICYKEVYIVD